MDTEYAHGLQLHIYDAEDTLEKQNILMDTESTDSSHCKDT